VGSDLVAAGIVGADLDEGAVLSRSAGEDFGSGRLGAEAFSLAWVSAGADFAAIARIVGDRRVDDDRCRDDALAAGEVSFLDVAGLELLSERIEGLLITRSEHHSRSADVESMEDAGLPLAVPDITHLWVTRDQGPCQRAELTLLQRMTRDSRGFVDDDVAGGFNEHVERQLRVGRSVEINRPGKAFQRDPIAGGHGETLLHQAPANPNGAFFD
jgi:hypothetical protein